MSTIFIDLVKLPADDLLGIHATNFSGGIIGGNNLPILVNRDDGVIDAPKDGLQIAAILFSLRFEQVLNRLNQARFIDGHCRQGSQGQDQIFMSFAEGNRFSLCVHGVDQL